jgi:hypothetical protein
MKPLVYATARGVRDVYKLLEIVFMCGQLGTLCLNHTCHKMCSEKGPDPLGPKRRNKYKREVRHNIVACIRLGVLQTLVCIHILRQARTQLRGFQSGEKVRGGCFIMEQFVAAFSHDHSIELKSMSIVYICALLVRVNLVSIPFTCFNEFDD